MKTLFLILVVLFIGISSSADYGPITMRENANITLDGGLIYKFQTAGLYNIEAFGADGSDSNGDGQAVQDALNYTNSVGGGILYAPPGTYLIDFRSYDANDVEPGNMLRMKSNVHLRGIPGKTVFKVADDMRNSTHSNCILYDFNASRNVHNWSIEGITFDGNLENNDVETGWTSTYDCIGANNASNYSITNCVFQNMVGRWAVFINIGSGTNYFQHNRIIGAWGNLSVVPDWTAVYLSGDNVFAESNLISPDAEPCNSSTGLEIHSAKIGIASGNVIRNTTNGIFMASDNGDGVRFYARDNDLKISAAGIATWNFNGHVVDIADIRNNNIEYISDIGIVGHGINIGHSHAANNGHVKEAHVVGNNIISGTGKPVWGITANDWVNLTVTDNTIFGPNKGGIVVLNNYSVSSQYLTVDRNILRDCGTVAGGLNAAIWATIDWSVPYNRFNFNDVSGTAYYGIYMFSDYTPSCNVTIKGNVADGVIGATAGIVGTKVIQTNGTVF